MILRPLLCLLLAAQAHALDLRLPTDNAALLKGGGPAYFQFVDRDFEGQKSSPWEGGQFGFVRDPRRVGSRIAYARFHEGMDVKPVRRDASGEPQDEVRAILPGQVVYVTASPSQSNYGRYVVVQHDLGEGPFYSLYAHLGQAQVTAGTKVAAGQALGRMGYTGAGIDKRRAHLHVELNIFLSTDFEAWHSSGFRTPNHHGVYNGMNLLGLDLQAVYAAHQRDPGLSLAAFVKALPAYYEITVPSSAKMEILKRYPWLLEGRGGSPASWKIRCNAWGIPVSVQPGAKAVAAPVVTWVKSDPIPHYYNTRGIISNSGQLTVEGGRFVQLLAGLIP